MICHMMIVEKLVCVVFSEADAASPDAIMRAKLEKQVKLVHTLCRAVVNK